PGDVVSVTGAPTAHGRVTFALRSRRGGARLTWAAPPGTALVWPVPYGVSGFRAVGARVEGGLVRLPGASGSLSVTWALRPGPTLVGTIARLRRSYGG
ncbi:MAG: hypothetical protein LC720_03820, partial [Actinobacteria bacterium]|nr:hypothetical protein [Actinomycetota bacterium]